jgi:hypothetical protein
LHSIPDNTRDVGNTARREVQPGWGEDIDLIAIKPPRKRETVVEAVGVGSHIQLIQAHPKSNKTDIRL